MGVCLPGTKQFSGGVVQCIGGFDAEPGDRAIKLAGVIGWECGARSVECREVRDWGRVACGWRPRGRTRLRGLSNVGGELLGVGGKNSVPRRRLGRR